MVAMADTQPRDKLARRLRELREREFSRLTQSELGQALADGDDPISPAAVSGWENPASGRLPTLPRLEAYARLFCTPRSFEGTPHMLAVADLTADERDRMEELKRELFGLRDSAALPEAPPAVGRARSMWHFQDGAPITLACYRMPPNRRPRSADPGELNYVRYAELSDLDTLIDIHGAVRAYNPTSRVEIAAAQDLTRADVGNHLVLIGGLAWEAVTKSLARIFPVPILPGDPGERDAIVVRHADGTEQEFTYVIVDGELVEDVGFFARGENPSAPRRTLTICGGITTRGVRGAARCFIDWEMRERNDQYLIPRFPEGSTYCIVMRVPVLNQDPLPPDLSMPENRLLEWCDSGTEAE
jgi:Helix-turn-helix domain